MLPNYPQGILVTNGIKSLRSNINLLDKRQQGLGKSTSAVVRAETYVTNGDTVILAYPDYDLAKEFASLVDTDYIIFKGRTQPGMCKILETVNVYGYFPPLFLCKYCNLKNGCPYQQQKEEIKKTKLIFTVYHNVPILLEMIPKPVVILDDVDITNLIYYKYEPDLKTLRFVQITLKNDYPTLSDAIHEWYVGNMDTALAKARSDAYKNELFTLESNLIANLLETPEFADVLRGYETLYALYLASKAEEADYDPKTLTIRWKSWILKKAKRIEYLKASITELQETLFAQLGEYEVWSKKVFNPNVRIIQLFNPDRKRRYYYCKTTLIKHPETFERLAKIVYEIAKTLNKFNQPLLVIMAKEVYDKYFRHSVFSQILALENVDFTFFWHKGTYGTNASYNIYNYVLILGTLNKPLETYQEPIYRENGIKRSQDSPFHFMHDETKKHIIDCMERLRLAVTPTRKLVVVLSEIPLDDLGYEIIKCKTTRTLLGEVNRGLAWSLDEDIKDYVVSRIYEIVGNEPHVPVVTIAKRLQEEIGCFSLPFWKEKVLEVATALDDFIVTKYKGMWVVINRRT